MLVNPGRYSPASAPCCVRAAAAKKRKTSAIAGISSFKAAASGLPVFSDSNFANAGPSASMRSAKRSSSAARSFGTVCAQPGPANSAAATAASSCARLASCTSAMRLPLAGSSTCSRVPSPFTRAPLIKSLVCMAISLTHRGTLSLVHVVEGQRMRRRRGLQVLAADLELGAVHRDRHVETRDRHRFAGQGRDHGASDHAHPFVAGIDRIAHVRRHLALDQQAENLEALLALEPGMRIGAAKIVLAGAHREIEPEFPQAVARRVALERIHLGHVVRIEQEIALDP